MPALRNGLRSHRQKRAFCAKWKKLPAVHRPRVGTANTQRTVQCCRHDSILVSLRSGSPVASSCAFFCGEDRPRAPFGVSQSGPESHFGEKSGPFLQNLHFLGIPGVAGDHQWLGIISGWLLSTRLQNDPSLEERSPEPDAETCILRKMEKSSVCAPTARRHFKRSEDSAMLSP